MLELLQAIVIRLNSSGFFQIFRFYYSLFFCFEISFKTAVNSICLGTCSSCFSFRFSLVKVFLEAGAKVKLVFLTGKKILKFFLEIFYLFASGFLINLSRNFSLFCGVQM